MISASLSLSLPRLGWKSTSMPRSLKICTAAGDSASEMRTLGFDIGLFLHPPLQGEGGGGGVKPSFGNLGGPNGGSPPPPPPDPGGRRPPPFRGRKKNYAAF